MIHPLKIAFIRAEFDQFGGAERFTNALMQSLAGQGAEIHIFARKWQESSQMSYTVHQVGGFSCPSLLRQISFVNSVKKHLQNNHFDLIQSNERTLSQHIYRAGDGVHSKWLELRKEHVCFLKRVSLTINPFHLYTLYLERKMFEQEKLRAIIVNSEMVRSEIISRFNVADNKIHTIYNGVDLKKFKPENRKIMGRLLRQEYNISTEEPIILFVGSGYERKGVSQLLHAASQLKLSYRLWIIGKDSTKKYIRMAQELGMRDQVTFWGKQNNVEKFYAAADFFVLPTLYDPFPSVALEAMASGLPIVITKTCGVAEVIRHDQEGFILSKQDDVFLANYLQILTANKEKRLKMSKNAVACAQKFSFHATVQQFVDLYQQIIDENSNFSKTGKNNI